MPWSATVCDAPYYRESSRHTPAFSPLACPHRYRLPPLADVYQHSVESSDISMRRVSESERGLGYPIPPREEERLATIRALELESYKGDTTLTALCKLLAETLKVPIAGINLVTEDRAECIAQSGPDISASREDSFCAWTLSSKSPEVLVVEDATKDARFATKAHVVSGPKVRYYASAPLIATNGQRVGALCVMDLQPRQKSAEEYLLLCNLAELAMRELEGPRFQKLQEEGTRLQRPVQTYDEGVMLCEVTTRWWDMKFVNPPALAKSAALRSGLVHFWSIFQPADGAKNMAQKLAQAEIDQGNAFTLHVKLRDARSSNKDALTIHFRPALQSCLSSMPTGIPNIVKETDPAQVKHTFYFAIIKEKGRSSEDANSPVPLGSPQTFLSREFRTSKTATDSSGMRDVTLGVTSASSHSSRIYRATWNKKTVSVKFLVVKISQCVQSKEYGTAWIPKEAALAAELMHPNVIRTYKIVVEPKFASKDMFMVKKGEEVVEAWIVREMCAKGDLQGLAHQIMLYNADGTPNLALVLEVALEIASAMTYLHQHNIIHNYIRPTSIVMGEDTHNKSNIKDFAAKISSFTRAVISQGPIAMPDMLLDVTFIPYAAPELFLKNPTVSKASDVYSYGKVIWELYSHDLVPMALDHHKLKRRAAGKNELPVFPEGMPKPLERLLRDCLATKPSQRPDFSNIKERLRRMNEIVARGGKLEEELPIVEPSRQSFSRSKSSQPRRSSMEEARVAIGSLFQNRTTPLHEAKSIPPAPRKKLSFKEDLEVAPGRDSSPHSQRSSSHDSKSGTPKSDGSPRSKKSLTQERRVSISGADTPRADSPSSIPRSLSKEADSDEANGKDKKTRGSSASILSKKLRSMISFPRHSHAAS